MVGFFYNNQFGLKWRSMITTNHLNSPLKFYPPFYLNTPRSKVLGKDINPASGPGTLPNLKLTSVNHGNGIVFTSEFPRGTQS